MKIPKISSKRYKEIIEKGCGLYMSETWDGLEWDCSHNYDWVCDNCPCTIEYQKVKEEIRKNTK